jgi:hypothetical protein
MNLEDEFRGELTRLKFVARRSGSPDQALFAVDIWQFEAVIAVCQLKTNMCNRLTNTGRATWLTGLTRLVLS